MKTVIYFLTIFLSTSFLTAQITLEWEKNYGGTEYDSGDQIIETEDGGFVFVGRTKSSDIDVNENYGDTDAWLVKTDAAGNIEWEKNYGGSNKDNFTSIAITNDGGFIIGGSTGSSDGDINDYEEGNGYDWWVLKTDQLGNIEWSKTYGGSNGDYISCILPIEDGSFLIGGDTYSNNQDVSFNHGERDMWVINIDANGNLKWEQTFGDTGFDFFETVIKTKDGNYLLGGSFDDITDDNCGLCIQGDYWLAKITLEGTVLWTQKYGGDEEEFLGDVIETNDGGFLLGGESRSITVGFYSDWWLIKVDPEGNYLWEQQFDQNDSDFIESIHQTADNGFLINGMTNQTARDVWIAKLDEAGNLEESQILGGNQWDAIYSSTALSDGSFLIIGESQSSNGTVSDNYGSYDIWLFKINLDAQPIGDIQANLQVFLEGAFDPATNQMKTTLQDLDLLPLSQPFQTAPYNYDGNEQVASSNDFPDDVVDWVLVEVRSGTPDLMEAQTVWVESAAALLLVDGSIVNVEGENLKFDNLTAGASYHFLIRHRNHLDVLSNEPVVANTQMQYDFTATTSQAFGSGQLKELINGKASMFVGDYTQDGIIQVTDYSVWGDNPAQNNVYEITDGTMDGVVQNTDIDAWIPNKAKLGTVEVRF